MGGTTAGNCEPVNRTGWKRKVKVLAEKNSKGEVEFQMDSDLKGSDADVVFDKTKDKMPKRDFYLVEFDLDDDTGLDLEFAPDPRNALWVAVGTETEAPPCPENPSHSDEFYAVGIGQSGKRLTVRNDNETKAKFSFSLNFLKGGADPEDPNSYVRYDPIGDNRDGGV